MITQTWWGLLMKKVPNDLMQRLSGKQSKLGKQGGLSSKQSKPGYKRQTYIIKKDYIEKIKALAFWERKEITQVINELLEESLKNRKVKE